jgi:hypothetical protein
MQNEYDFWLASQIKRRTVPLLRSLLSGCRLPR